MYSRDLESLTSEILQESDRLGLSPHGRERVKTGFFKTSHFKAILFRRWVLIKRSLRMILVTFLMTLSFTMLAILAHYLMETLIHEYTWPFDFTFLSDKPSYIAIAADQDGHDHLPFVEHIANIYREDTGREPQLINFSSRDELNNYLFTEARDHPGKSKLVSLGVSFNSYYPYYNITALYNESSLFTNNLAAEVLINRMVWKQVIGKDYDFKFTVVWMLGKLLDIFYAQIGPAVATVGLLSIIPLLVAQPITDIRGEVRQYMVSATLSLFPYWLATFLLDLIVWELAVIIIWAVFLACQIPAFLDNKINTLYVLTTVGPCFILFTYCMSFTCSSPESAARQLFVVLCVIMIMPIIVDYGRQEYTDPVWLDWIYGFFPHVLMQRAFAQMFMRINFAKQPLKYYWTENSNTQAFFIMEILDIPFYAFVLWLIETLRIKLGRSSAERTYGNYTQFFADQKAKHPVTKEARELEEMVRSGVPLAVKVDNVSRLFFNTEGVPISAVNSVTLGVKEGQLFGFLGANGAGKTTLMKMITSMVPASNGTIEIDGHDISKDFDPTLISVCPQFNTHLCYEMTPREHFYLYHLLHHYDDAEAEEAATHLLEALDLMKFADKPVGELSGGNMRKLAIALAFFSRSKIILLDEPTSSLDPVARKCVHDLIMAYRGQRTFMLCTHLLSEAEFLCDVISIMIKGCVYTFGTPQYLSQKFGTEYKIDIMLDDDSEESYAKCDNFFERELPLAELTIARPKARIYSIPAAVIKLPDLFERMGAGKRGDNGFSYYTCSSSSLERVFMEIVRLSEMGEEEGVTVHNSTLQSRLVEETQEQARPVPPSQFVDSNYT